MKTIKIGEKSSFQIKNANVVGFFLVIYAVAHVVAEDPVFVPDKCRISAKLRQSGFNDTILDGLVRSLWRGTAPRDEYAASSLCYGSRIVVQQAGGVVGILEQYYKILFPTTIIMNGEDTMDVEIEFPADALTNHDPALCYLGIREIYGTGTQFFIPRIREYTLPTLDTKYEKYLGDNILRVVLMGGTTNTPVLDGLTQIDFTSDRKTDLLDIQELSLESTANLTKGVVFIKDEMDQVKVKCTMDGTSNAAGELKMVVTDYYIDAALVASGSRRQKKHAQKLASKV